MRNPWRKSFIVLALVFAATSVWHHGFAGTAQGEAQREEIPLKKLRLFSDIFARIKTDYVEEVASEELIDDAISGMLQGLDPHSQYLKKQAYEDLKTGTTGQFGGLGIEFVMDDGLVRVMSLVEDGPAEKIGLQRGDLIFALDGDEVSEMQMNDAVSRMRGEVGTTLTLSVRREDAPDFDTVITRAVITVKSIKTAVLAPEIGYIRIKSFQNKTGNELREQLRLLLRDNKGLRGIVLDLRSNPGGVLNAAVEASEVFLGPEQMIVYTKGRVKNSSVEFKTRQQDRAEGIQLVVLIDQGSASASEILAGALQDHGRARLIGMRSFGKASVQTVHELDEETAIRLTTAKYYTPSGRSIHGVGIEPDVVLEADEMRAELEAIAASTAANAIPRWKKDFTTVLHEDPWVQRALGELKLLIAQAQ